MKRNNTHIIGIPEREEEQQGIENLSEKVMTENFPNLIREKNHTSPGSTEGHSQKESKQAHCKTPRHIIIKLAKFKDKERIIKVARENQLVTYKGAPGRLSADYSAETL